MQKNVYQKEVDKLELEGEKLKQDIITLTEFSTKIMELLVIFEEAKIDPNKPIFDSWLVIVWDDEWRVERRLYLIDFLNNYSLRGVISLLEDESFSFSIPKGFKDIIYDFIFCINDVICDSKVCINNKLTEYLKNKWYDIYDHPINYTIAYLDAEKRNLGERIDNLKGNLELIYWFLKEYNRRVTCVKEK